MRPYRYAKLSVRALLHMIDVCVKEECCVYRAFGHVDYVYLRIIGEEATAILVSSPSDVVRARSTGRGNVTWDHIPRHA